MGNKHRILFVLPGLFGHLVPSFPVAKHLMDAGHVVGYCTGSLARDVVAKAGIPEFFPRESIHEPTTKILERSIYKYFYQVSKIFSVEVMKKYYLELKEAFETFKPDVVYLDTADFLAGPVVQRFNLPYAHVSATVPFYFEMDIPPFGTGWDMNTPWRNRLKLIPFLSFIAPFVLKRLNNQKKALHQIDPEWNIKDLRDVSPFLYLLFSTDKLEYPRKEFIPQMFYVGPSIPSPSGEQKPGFPWEKLDKNRPLIYIAAGTLFFDQYKEFYQNAVKALSSKTFPVPVQVVLATGKEEFIAELGEIPPNFIVVKYAPQIELLEKARIMVTHGGANSVNEALSYGIPMFVVHCGGDRMEVGKRVAYQGAGICMDVQNATDGKIRENVLRLLETPTFTQRAQGIMESFRRCDGPKTAAELILRLADTGKPILRKKEAPITLENIADLPAYIERGSV